MNGLEIFKSPEFGQVRVTMKGGEPWFVAADVCRALELDRTQTRRLDEDEKGVYSTQTPGGDQEMSIVNEPGLYTLVLGSRKPEAKAFKRWITHDVIPSLRKEGAYTVPEAPAPPTPTPPQGISYTQAEANRINACVAQGTLLAQLANKQGLRPQIVEALVLAAAGATLGMPLEVDYSAPIPPPPALPPAPPQRAPSAPALGPRAVEVIKTFERMRAQERGRLYTATEVAGAAGTSSAWVGTLANRYGLKTPENGEFKKIYDRFSGRDVECFFYNERGRAELLKQLEERKAKRA